MDESERLQRLRQNHYNEDRDVLDEEIARRILLLLDHPKIDKYCMVDAYYYDFSVIPRDIQDRFQLYRDCYIIFGITTEGEVVSKWIDRYDLDSSDEIKDGIVIKGERKNFLLPEIEQCFDANLLSTPVSDLINLFKIKEQHVLE